MKDVAALRPRRINDSSGRCGWPELRQAALRLDTRQEDYLCCSSRRRKYSFHSALASFFLAIDAGGLIGVGLQEGRLQSTGPRAEQLLFHRGPVALDATFQG